MDTPRELVRKTIRFETPSRLVYDLPEAFGNDFIWVGMEPSPDDRPPNGPDEWGAIWKNIGVCNLGEVQKPALLDWKDFDAMTIPDIHAPHRWTSLEGAREAAGDRYLIASGISLYERVHFIRGLENAWTDIYTERESLCKLIDILVEMNLVAIEKYAAIGADGYMFCDDWGLQNKMMIAPEAWDEIWKPRYAKIYKAAHDAGMQTLLHSCGHIVDILDGLIDAGLDVIQMDQQENMGLELLGERFGGRIAFWCPVDIQNTMARADADEIRAYCRRMVRALGSPKGGFIARWYGDPKGAGHQQHAIDAMSEEFLTIAEEMQAGSFF
jgi:uroporphyrinogen decarboxylase